MKNSTSSYGDVRRLSRAGNRLLVGLLCTLFGAVWFQVSVAHAWIPSVDTMERKLQSQRYPTANLHIELQSVSKPGTPSEVLDVIVSAQGRVLIRHHRISDGTVTRQHWDGSPEAKDRRSVNGRSVNGRSVNGEGGSSHGTAERASEPPAWVRWLSGLSPPALFRALRIDRSLSSLALSENTVLWVAGAKPRQLDRGQVHLERESGRLRRIVELRGGAVHDTSFSGNFQAKDSALIWPRFVTLRADGQAKTFEIVRVLPRAVFDEDAAVSSDGVEKPNGEGARSDKAAERSTPGEPR